MKRERTVAALVALLGLLVLATAASGITGTERTTAGSTDSGLGVGGGEGAGAGAGNETGIQFNDAGSTTGGSGEYFQSLFSAVILATLALGVLALVLTLLRDGLAGLKRLLAAAVENALLIAAVFGAVVAFLFLLNAISGDGGGGTSGAGSAPSVVGGGGQSATSTAFPLQPVLVVVLVGVVLVVAVLVIASSDGLLDRSADRGAGAPEDDEEPIAGSTVGDASAVVVEDVPASNAVYRTWLELARTVAQDRDSLTPAEVARNAVDAGFDERPVEELTTLFREVRYGDVPVTSGRERRARDAKTALGIEDHE